MLERIRIINKVFGHILNLVVTALVELVEERLKQRLSFLV
jgi:hypothetical protein